MKEHGKEEVEEESVENEEENPEVEVIKADEGEMLILRRGLSTQKSEKDE